MKKHYYHLQWDVTNSDPELYNEGKYVCLSVYHTEKVST